MNPLFLTINAYLALLVVFVNFIFAILVMVRSPRSLIYVIFFFICISNIFWTFGDFLDYLTKAQFWLYLSLIGSSMLPTLMFHFINALIRPEVKSSTWILPPYFFSGFLAFSSLLALFYPRVQWFVESLIWNTLYFILLGPFLLVGILMLFSAINRTKSGDEKSRLYYILIAALVAVPTGLTDLLQSFKIPVPPLGHIGCLGYSSILAVGIFKHRTTYDVLAQMRMKVDLMSEMAAGIAHEIRNPLTSIKAASSLLAEGLRGHNHPKCQEYCNLITEETERLINILGNFQYLSRPVEIERETVPLNEVIHKTVRLAEVDALNLRILLYLSRDLPMVQADASLMKQVFINMIKNAAEACGSEGELMIETETIFPFVKISFSDDGPGIPSNLLNRIFHPFFTTKRTGMGMGLTITQRIIEAHDGRIEVNNRMPKGTQFSIFLPI